MKKEKLLSKLNLNVKDYNIELEEILDKKAFSEEAQNLLLSIFYKIENFYMDYKVVKRQVPTRDLFIQNIIKIISKYCNEIEFIKPKGINKGEKFYINLEKGKIETFPNEITLMNALVSTGQIRKGENIELIDSSIIDSINIGNTLNTCEVIRDFNGWSWTSMLDTNDLILYNLVYQNLLIILGYDKIKKICSITKTEKIEAHIKKIINQELNNQIIIEFLKYFSKISVLLNCNKDEKFKQKIIKNYESLKEKIDVLNNKEELLTKSTENKKEIMDKIKKIDKMLNNAELLKEEYANRNKKLEEKDKIFSISDLVLILEEERKEFLKEIKEYNNLIDPKNYIKKKQEIEKKFESFKCFEIEENKTISIEEYVVEFQKIFLNCFKDKIKKCTLKKDLIDIIYEYRYYRLLKLKKDKEIKDEKKLKKENKEIIDEIIKKAEQLKVLEKISNNDKVNKIILEKVFNARIIALENIYIQLVEENNKMMVYYFDGNILETKTEIEMDVNSIKHKKKMKLFI